MKKLVLSMVGFGAVLSSGVNASENNGFDQLPLFTAGPLGHFQQDEGWRFGVGLGFESEAEYHGAKDNVSEADVYLEAGYRGENWDFSSNVLSNKLSYRVLPTLFASGWVNWEQGREEKEYDQLRGMGDIEDSTELGAGIDWLLGDNLSVSLAAQTYVGGDPSKGTVGFAAAHYNLVNNDNWLVQLGTDLSFATADHLQTEFGVTAAQASSSSFAAYDIGAGLKSYGVGVNTVYKHSEHLYFTAGVEFEKYASDIADSPLIKDAGSDTEYDLSLAVIYKF